MKLATVLATIAIAASASVASADQLAKSAGVPSGVYADTTLVNIINAKEEGNFGRVAHFLSQTQDNVRISSRGTAIDFDRLIEQAEQDGDSGKVASLKSLSNGDNYTGG
ncbi:hypothetical protein, partial [Nereida sp. MMG025]|uniref:hypothetical protein n=1 Tax=Nereida sp. MMG025 TaxID=2909981 RepID=UPI001F17E203